MTDLTWSTTPPRTELRRLVAGRLADVGSALRVIAEDVLGADAPIDLVAADPDGRVTVVLVGMEGDGLPLVSLGLAQRAWVEARLGDWHQLAPTLGLATGAGVRVMLVGPSFSSQALAAVRSADPEGFDLVAYRCLRNGAELQVLLEPCWLGGPPAPDAGRGGPPPGARFRTGLSDADLVVSSEERRNLA